MHRFYFPDDLQPEVSVALSKEESNHLAKVLRLEEGAEAQVFNGKGKVGRARIQISSGSKSVLLVESVEEVKERSRIHLVFAISKSAALDFIVHRATEVGVASLTPVVTRHSLAQNHFNRERWQKVVIEVCKQCQAAYLPEIISPIQVSDWLYQRDKERPLLFCDEEKRDAKPPFIPEGAQIDILLGAEGGWSEDERKKILSTTAIPFGLGHTRLRAETAALVATVLAKKCIGEIP